MADSTDTPNITAGLQGMAHVLGLRENFLIELLLDPDEWSFVVKVHALLESIICTLLSMHLRKPELEEVLAEKVEMHARIEMTRALGITTSEDKRFMTSLGKLRNDLVHNAKDTNFTFAEYFTNKDLKRNFAETFGYGWPDPIPGTSPSTSRADFVIANPKFAVFKSVLGIATYVMREASTIQTEMALQGLRNAASTMQEKVGGSSPA